MDVDRSPQQRYRGERGGAPGELKIKGQAGRQGGPGARREERGGQRDISEEVGCCCSFVLVHVLIGVDRV